jgi:sulfite reductase (ferredoxin)
VHIEDTPDLMRRLAAVGITTREACGNSVRNVTACPYSGVCNEETFDVTPYADAMAFFLLGHDDTQDFGRKFKIAFSGCKDNPCALTNFHDLGCIARTRNHDGILQRGFEFYVGGGLGAVPHDAKLVSEFVTERELLPLAQAVCRVFGRLGEKENRSRARIKFLVKKLGIEEFKRLVFEEREKLRPDPRWSAFLEDLHSLDEKPIRPPGELDGGSFDPRFERWRANNVRAQKQSGYYVATVTLALGDFTSEQGRALADIARRFCGDTLRTTVDQNLIFRWISGADLVAFWQKLEAIGLGEPGADTIADVTACPGTDTCKLGISSSRGLAAELNRRLRVLDSQLAPAARSLHIKCSGCFNSCGQHHVADLGFLGVSRNVNGRRVPHFQLVVGGEWTHNAASFGLAVGAVPSKNVPQVVERLTGTYVAEKHDAETFPVFIARIGKKRVRGLIEDLIVVPPYEVDPSYYSDWGDPREYTIGDMGVGECAGEVVPFVQMGLAASEREIFEAQLLLDEGKPHDAAERAYSAMIQAARALTREKNPNLGDDPKEIVREFRTHWYDTKLFFDPYAGGKFAHYLFRVHDDGVNGESNDAAHQLIEEAQLFVDAAHQAQTRIANVMP